MDGPGSARRVQARSAEETSRQRGVSLKGFLRPGRARIAAAALSILLAIVLSGAIPPSAMLPSSSIDAPPAPAPPSPPAGDLRQESSEALLQLAQEEMRRGALVGEDQENALARVRQAIQLDPDNSQAPRLERRIRDRLISQAESLSAQRAADRMRELERLFPSDRRVIGKRREFDARVLAYAAKGKGRTDEAERRFAELVQLNPRQSRYWLDLAEIRENRMKFGQAAQALKSARDLLEDPDPQLDLRIDTLELQERLFGIMPEPRAGEASHRKRSALKAPIRIFGKGKGWNWVQGTLHVSYSTISFSPTKNKNRTGSSFETTDLQDLEEFTVENGTLTLKARNSGDKIYRFARFRDQELLGKLVEMSREMSRFRREQSRP